MAKVVVLGGEGMLGHKMFQILREYFPDVVCTIREGPQHWLRQIDLLGGRDVVCGVDAACTSGLRNLLGGLAPEVVVNCIGIVKQRPEAASRRVCIRINALLPHELAAMTSEWGGRVIHFSTDCVFSGSRGRYTEDDESDATDVYGRTKFLGEVADENALTLRTSMIGRELAGRASLLEWFLSQEHARVPGYTRVIYSGVTTNHLAHLTGWLIQARPRLHGLFQVSSAPLSKYALLCSLKTAYGRDVTIVPDDGPVCDRSLDGSRFEATAGYRCPAWEALIGELACDKTPYERWCGYAAAAYR